MEMPCVHCGDCAAACPAGLQPQRLLHALAAQRPGAAQALGLSDCSECGRCDLACPSRIELRARFVLGKREALARDELLAQAAAARARYEARGLRLLREADERARESTLAQAATSGDAVAAAIARAQARRRPPPGNP